MELTDNQREKQPLLDQGVILLTGELEDYSDYVMMSWAIAYLRDKSPSMPIELRITGPGGDLYPALSICDLVRHDGNITGLLAGGASSAHGLIWASCSIRYVLPFAFIGVHGPQYSGHDVFSPNEIDSRYNEKVFFLDIAARILHDMCKDISVRQWSKIMADVGLGQKLIPAQDLAGHMNAAQMLTGPLPLYPWSGLDDTDESETDPSPEIEIGPVRLDGPLKSQPEKTDLGIHTIQASGPTNKDQ